MLKYRFVGATIDDPEEVRYDKWFIHNKTGTMEKFLQEENKKWNEGFIERSKQLKLMQPITDKIGLEGLMMIMKANENYDPLEDYEDEYLDVTDDEEDNDD